MLRPRGPHPALPPACPTQAAPRTPAAPASQTAAAPGQEEVFGMGQAHGARDGGQVHARPQLQQRQVRGRVPGGVLVRHEACHPLLLRARGQQHPPGFKVAGWAVRGAGLLNGDAEDACAFSTHAASLPRLRLHLGIGMLRPALETRPLF